MASAGPYQPVTFTANRPQRAKRRFTGFLFIAVGIGMLALSGRVDTGRGPSLILSGLCFIALGVLSLALYRRAYTTIDAEGLATSVLWGRRTCRWADVTDVELNVDASEGPPAYNIIIHCRGGRSFELAAPKDAETRDRHENPEFQGQLALINSYWRNGAGLTSR
jgi:hypothetical protein